ncbi:MAG: DUF72 domain-containing protein [Nitrososphaerales archaeon]
MKEDASLPIVVGVGGWAYLPVRNVSRLELCAQIFDFVEVNSSFYKPPPLKQAERWRTSVPENFEFTVRASSKLTHVNHMEPTEENFAEFGKSMDVCRALHSNILHFQFPPSFPITEETVQNWRQFFQSLNKIRDMHYAFEIRNAETARADHVRKFLSDFDIIPTSDASREKKLETSSRSGILYSRVFGLGDRTKWSFSTDELMTLKEKVGIIPATRRYLTFHNITMYEDGARMKNVIKEGKDILPQREVGLDSLKRALIAARIDFPISRETLMSEMAWRTIDIGKDTSIHADKILSDLTEGESYSSMDDVLRKISMSMRSVTNQFQ